MSALLTADGLLALVTLTAMEIVLGIDNVVFIAILTSRCPPRSARRAALGLGAGALHAHRAALHHHLGDGPHPPLFTVLGRGFSGAISSCSSAGCS